MHLIPLLLALFVWIAYVIQAMTGFGSIIIAVTLGSHFFPIEFLLPTIIPVDILVNLHIVAKYREHVNQDLLFRRIAPWMGIGLVIGIGAFQFVQGTALKRSFGVLVALLCLRELARLRQAPGLHRTLPARGYALSVLAAGVIQGLFASGGPLLVYAVGRLNLKKARFRSTLSLLWLMTNSVLTLSYAVTGRITARTLGYGAWLAPVIPVAVWTGERLHDHVEEDRFRVIVFVILLLAGLSVAVR